ncbi:MAG: UPF0182 family protein [Kineosporiaceae bacterium]
MSEDWPPSGPQRTDPPRRPVPRRRRGGVLLPTVVVVGVVVVGFVAFADLFTDYLWYQQLGFAEVLRTRLVTQLVLFLLGGAVMAAAVWVSLSAAYRTRPIYAPTTPEQASLDRYRETLEPLRRLVAIAVPATLGLFAGSAAAAQWQNVLLFLNSQPFDTRDAIFGEDVGFYVFSLPMLQFAVGFATAVVLLAGIGGLVTHYLYGGVRIGGPGPRTTTEARIHLAVLAALFLLIRAAGYWLERYTLLTSQGDLIAGPGYTAVNAVIPVRTVLAVAAILVALAFVWTAARGNWRIPALGVAMLVVVAIVAGGVLPQVIQSFIVGPNAQDRERPYIENNIAATREAYDLDDIETIRYEAELATEEGALAEDARTLPSVRLLDPALVTSTFQQLQQVRPFYGFPDPLDVDRYEIDGEVRDTVIAARDVDLAGLPASQRNWVNDHTVYTHGFGVVAAWGNRRTPDGEPVFFQSGIPPVGDLGGLEDFEQRVYFGEDSPEYSIVGGPEGSAPVEYDFPRGDGDQANLYTYEGDGGVAVGDPFRRLLFAVKFRAEQILLSDRVNSESRIMFDRQPRERVERVAPWLTLDGDPYPAVVDGRVLWLLDGYTTTANYPYSRSTTLEEATQTTLTETGQSVQALLPEQVNYVRNSVKATVDAYTGEVRLYAWDPEDPVLRAWSAIFPGAVTPLDEVPGALMRHFRYPQDLFNIQRQLLERYHITDPGEFFTGEDYWSVPPDPTVGGEGAVTQVTQPPYYLSLRMPGQDEPAFSLTSTFIPTTQGQSGQRNILRGFLAADGDAGSEDGQVREGYGQLRLLEIVNSEPVSGPGQVQNDFNSNNEIASELNVLQLGESTVLRGNLLTLPVGGGLLYVQPVYVRSVGETSFPLLRRVLVAFGNEVGFGETLDEALDQVFEGESGVDTGEIEGGGPPTPDEEVTPPATDEPTGTPTEEPSVTETPEPTPTETGDAAARLQQALADANEAIQDGEQALRDGDFAAYGEAQERLQDAIERALAAEAELTGETAPEAAGEATSEPTEGATGR